MEAEELCWQVSRLSLIVFPLLGGTGAIPSVSARLCVSTSCLPRHGLIGWSA